MYSLHGNLIKKKLLENETVVGLVCCHAGLLGVNFHSGDRLVGRGRFVG